MEDLCRIPHITNPVLHIFEGELIRIGFCIKAVPKNQSALMAYGKLYGLYTHSSSAVVHYSAIEWLTKRAIRDILSSRIENVQTDYGLSCVGELFPRENIGVPFLELLRKKAALLNESETSICIAVDTTGGFTHENVLNYSQAFFLLKDTVCKMNMKVIRGRESPFRLDSTFEVSLRSSCVQCYTRESKSEFSTAEQFGTELEDMSEQSSKTTCDANLNELSDLQENETGNKGREVEIDSLINSSKEKEAELVLPSKESSLKAADKNVEVDEKVQKSEVDCAELEEEVPSILQTEGNLVSNKSTKSERDSSEFNNTNENEDIIIAKPIDETNEAPEESLISIIPTNAERDKNDHENEERLATPLGSTNEQAIFVSENVEERRRSNKSCDETNEGQRPNEERDLVVCGLARASTDKINDEKIADSQKREGGTMDNDEDNESHFMCLEDEKGANEDGSVKENLSQTAVKLIKGGEELNAQESMSAEESREEKGKEGVKMVLILKSEVVNIGDKVMVECDGENGKDGTCMTVESEGTTDSVSSGSDTSTDSKEFTIESSVSSEE